MSAEIALQDAAILRTIEQRTPSFEFAHTRRSFPGMELSHTPVIQILASAHGVGKVNAPAVPIVNIGHGRSDSTFCHHGMGFAKKRLRHDRDFCARSRSLYRSAQPRASRSDDHDIMLVRDVLGH
jgi:hypothetical protein